MRLTVVLQRIPLSMPGRVIVEPAFTLIDLPGVGIHLLGLPCYAVGSGPALWGRVGQFQTDGLCYASMRWARSGQPVTSYVQDKWRLGSSQGRGGTTDFSPHSSIGSMLKYRMQEGKHGAPIPLPPPPVPSCTMFS